MKEIELIQGALARSAERLFNAEAECRANIDWILCKKAEYIVSKLREKTFTVKSLISKDHWAAKYYIQDAIMKPVILSYRTEKYNFLRELKNVDGYNYPAYLEIDFMIDPQYILKLPIKLTDKERSILSKLKRYYSVFKVSQKDGERLLKLSSDLEDLKNHIHVSYSGVWKFTLSDMLGDDFITRGLKKGNTSILSSYYNSL